ncbi:pentapeptide repeat-containing protein [Nostoc flagelliforme]|uniref:pentapeptide repeat-containing protein n=1 Tax=Nostoc flagelliforme TaxID=1306274 RepID=UPI000C2D52B9
MANEEQILIIEQGVKTWNDWRSKNKKIVVDLSNADFSNSNLSNVDFRYANLAGASQLCKKRGRSPKYSRDFIANK